jgi:hypothetical protein
MRKIVFWIVFIALFSITTCKTENTAAVSSGSWTFQSATYNDSKGTPGIWHGALVSAIAQINGTLQPSLVVSNYGTNSFATGTYQVGSDPGTVDVQVIDSIGVRYMPLPNNTGTVTVNASNGKVLLSSAGISMVKFGVAPYSDTMTLSFNITQTY